MSAAWLIEHSGLRKGFKLPRSRAALSSKHALALTNRGTATAAELAELARYIQGRVQSEFGLILQPEPVLVGVDLSRVSRRVHQLLNFLPDVLGTPSPATPAADS